MGKITSVLDQAYLEKSRDSVRWWNGSAFVAEPVDGRALSRRRSRAAARLYFLKK